MRWAILVATTSALITGCATQKDSIMLAPNGKLYWAGGPNCIQANFIKDNKIECLKEDGTPTGYREPITPQQAQVLSFMLQQAELRRAQELQQLNQSMQQLNSSIIIPQYPTYSAPAIGPYIQPRSNQIRCIGAGIYTNCRY